ncbi:MAG: serine/threonine protein kinase [Chloroflexaceae bacterium]|nr:serine/threonine protein kinase [Chloroflexaceae bacterium]
MIAPNTMLQNRYLVKRHIGRGGMGTVYEAFDTRLHATVALKETLLTDQASLKAFEREAALLARMRHPVLPKVIDYFTEHAGQFLVMEYIQGDDLAKLMEQRGGAFPLDSVLPWAMHWADQLLDALTYLHEQSPPIYHRDIKPQNLKLTAQGDIILLDFGLAKGGLSDVTALSPSRDNRSITGYTPNYAPLEQIRGAPPDPRTDLYSLGATLYHLSTGVKPPDALSRAAALLNNQKDPLLPAHHHNPNIPPAVSAVLHGAMALSPEGRAPSAAIMRKALLRARSQGAADDANTRTDVMDKTEMTGSGSTIQQSSDSLTLQSVHASVQAGVVNITTSAAPSIVSQSEQPSATEVVSPETPALHLDPVSEVNLYRTLLTGHQMLCLAFSPDSQRIVGGGLYGPEGQMRTPGQNALPV